MMKRLIKRIYEIFVKMHAAYENRQIKWDFCFEIDRTHYIFAFFPTIVWAPSHHRPVGCSIIEIMWLNMHIGIGEWRVKHKEESPIEDEPVEKLHWIDLGYAVECPICGFTCNDEYYLGDAVACPNCGIILEKWSDYE